MHIFSPSAESTVSTDVYTMPLENMVYIDQSRHTDHRGYYAEVAKIPELDAHLSEPFIIKQINLSYSEQDVIRGIHAENWNKLVTITTGTAYCVWVDLREDSSTYAQTVAMYMGESDTAHKGSVFIPAGVGNSFLVIDGPAHYIYSVDALYAERDTSNDVAISLFDPDLDIDWPIPRDQMIMSDRDKSAITLKERLLK